MRNSAKAVICPELFFDPSALYTVMGAAVVQVGMLCFSTKAQLMALLVQPLSTRAEVLMPVRLLGTSISMLVVRALSLPLNRQM